MGNPGRPVGLPKTGGRKKGSPNKRTRELIERADAIGVDPFEILLRFAKGDWKGLGYESETMTKIAAGGVKVEIERIDPELRMKAAAEAAQYLYPKRKAIELKSDQESPIEVYLRMDPLERARMIEKLGASLGLKSKDAVGGRS